MTKKQQSTIPNKKPFSIGGFFDRYHAVMFFVVVCGGLTVAVYLLSTVISQSSTSTDYTPPLMSTSFDKQTIDRVDNLRPLNTPPAPLQLPSSQRHNPFPS